MTILLQVINVLKNSLFQVLFCLHANHKILFVTTEWMQPLLHYNRDTVFSIQGIKSYLW